MSFLSIAKPPVAKRPSSNKNWVKNWRRCASYFWMDNWFPSNMKFKPFTPMVSNPTVTKVIKLIDPTMRTWRLDLLERTFLAIDIARIKSIPLALESISDIRAWLPRRCYWFLLHLKSFQTDNSMTSGDEQPIPKQFWNGIYKLLVSPSLSFWIERPPTTHKLYQ